MKKHFSVLISLAIIALVGFIIYCNLPTTIPGRGEQEHGAYYPLTDLPGAIGGSQQQAQLGKFSKSVDLPENILRNIPPDVVGVIIHDDSITAYKYDVEFENTKGAWVRNTSGEKIFIPMEKINQDYVVDLNGVWLGWGILTDEQAIKKTSDSCPPCYCGCGCYWCCGSIALYGSEENFLYFIGTEPK